MIKGVAKLLKDMNGDLALVVTKEMLDIDIFKSTGMSTEQIG